MSVSIDNHCIWWVIFVELVFLPRRTGNIVIVLVLLGPTQGHVFHLQSLEDVISELVDLTSCNCCKFTRFLLGLKEFRTYLLCLHILPLY